MRPELYKVTVLLATFNGDRYLERQLTSLANQIDVQIEVIAHDDGSTDETRRILESWQKKGLITKIYDGKKIGSTESFLKLLEICNEKDYVAFCDQDDVWHPRKLISQVEKSNGIRPTAVIAGRRYINENGRVVGRSPELKVSPSFKNALVENVAYGNTILLNRSAVQLLNSIKVPEIRHYDSWIYLVISGLGEIVSISEPLIDYRLHAHNSVGLRSYSLNSFHASMQSYVIQNLYFLDAFGSQLNPELNSTVKIFAKLSREKNPIKRFKLIQSIGFKRQKIFDQIAFKIILTFAP